MSARGLGSCKVIGYTEMRTNCDSLPCIFHAHPWYGNGPWYDECMIFEITNNTISREVDMYELIDDTGYNGEEKECN